MQDEKSAAVGISRKTDVGDAPVISGRHTLPGLPGRTIEEDAFAAAAAGPSVFLRDRAIRYVERKASSAYRDNCRIRSRVFRLLWTVGGMPVRTWIGPGVAA